MHGARHGSVRSTARRTVLVARPLLPVRIRITRTSEKRKVVRVTSTYLKKAKPQSERTATDVAATVSEIIKDVRADGDAAVRRYSEKFDKWNPPSFKLDQEAIDKAIASLPAVVLDDLKFAQHQ